MGIKFSNNASANIIQALTSTATSVSITEGKGDLFPSLTEGDYFYATLAGNNGLEIVKVTNRIKDTMTIVRAQDNTTALSFDTGDLFELRIVAADFNDTFYHVETTLEDTVSHVETTLKDTVSNVETTLEDTVSHVETTLKDTVSNVETTLEDTVDTLNSSVDNKMSSYLPLSGGTMTGVLTLGKMDNEGGELNIQGSNGTNGERVIIDVLQGTNLRFFCVDKDGNLHTENVIMFDPETGSFTKGGADILTSAGGNITGPLKSAAGTYALTSAVTNSLIRILGGTSPSTGANLDLYGEGEEGGKFVLRARTSSGYKALTGTLTDLTWGSNSVLTSEGGTLTGPLTGSLIATLSQHAKSLFFGGMNGINENAPLLCFDGPNGDSPGRWYLLSSDGSKKAWLVGYPNGVLELQGNRILSGVDIQIIAPSTPSFTLPSGGTWRYICVRNSGDTNIAQVGTAAGGTTVAFGHEVPRVFAIRIS